MKDSVYMLLVDVWRLAMKFGFRKMGDSEWETFIDRGKKLVMRYKEKGEAMERLCRDLLSAFQSFYEQIGGADAGRDIKRD